MSNSYIKAYKKWKKHCSSVQSATKVKRLEQKGDKDKRIKRAKKDYAYFVEEYFPHYATDPCADFHIIEATKVLKDPNFFGVWEWPREHAKSVHAGVILPIWLWINGELDGMVLKGKNEKQANKLLGHLQAEFESNELILQDFGEQKQLGSWTDGEFEINDGVRFEAYGRKVPVRGTRNQEKRPNFYLGDDLDDDEIVENQDRVEKVVDIIIGSDYGAMDIRKSRFLVVGNGIHPKSILRHIVGDIDGEAKRPDLHHSHVMATVDGTFTGKPSWWQKYTSEQLQRRFRRMGTFKALREYFHKSVIKGKIWKNEWFHWGRIPKLNQMDFIVAYFDPSYKAKTTSDYKAIKVWGKKKNNYYQIGAFVKQATITEACRWMYDFHESLPEDVTCHWYMEDVFLQDMFYKDIAGEGEIRGYHLPMKGDKRKKPEKFGRVLSIASYWERGLVTYDQRKKKDDHFRVGNDQLLGFSKNSDIHDDGPDADEGAIWMLNDMSRKESFPGTVGKRKNEGGY